MDCLSGYKRSINYHRLVYKAMLEKKDYPLLQLI